MSRCTRAKALGALFAVSCGRPPPAAAPRVADAEATTPRGGHAHGHHHAHGPLVHRFEDAAHWAKSFDDPARDAWQRPREVVAAMGIAPGMTVADVGAGTGYFEPYLSEAVGPSGAVLALDAEPDMVAYMEARAAREGLGNVKPALVPFDDPKLPEGGVDRVLLVDVWHHVDHRVQYAHKLAGALRPGGRIYVVDFKLDAAHGPPPQHRLPPETVVAELAAAGLDARVVASALPDQYVVVGAHR